VSAAARSGVPPAAALAAAAGGWVVMEQDGRLWGVSGTAIEGLRRRGPEAESELRLTVSGGELAADRVLAVVPDLRVVPAPATLRRFWSEAATGLAVYLGRPLLVIDAAHPPRVLLAEDE